MIYLSATVSEAQAVRALHTPTGQSVLGAGQRTARPFIRHFPFERAFVFIYCPNERFQSFKLSIERVTDDYYREIVFSVGTYVCDEMELLIRIDASVHWSLSFGCFGKSNRNDFSPVSYDYY